MHLQALTCGDVTMNDADQARQSQILTSRPFLSKWRKIWMWDVFLGPAPWVLGDKTRLHTPKAVVYHEQSQIMNYE